MPLHCKLSFHEQLNYLAAPAEIIINIIITSLFDPHRQLHIGESWNVRYLPRYLM